MTNIISEIKEARLRIKEYIDYVRKHPKSERDELSEVILKSYREVVFMWFIGLLGSILLYFVLQLITGLFINILF